MIFFALTSFQLFGMDTEKAQHDVEALNKQVIALRVQTEQLAQEQEKFQRASSKHRIILDKRDAEIARAMQELEIFQSNT